jgi:hypothetical protein
MSQTASLLTSDGVSVCINFAPCPICGLTIGWARLRGVDGFRCFDTIRVESHELVFDCHHCPPKGQGLGERV